MVIIRFARIDHKSSHILGLTPFCALNNEMEGSVLQEIQALYKDAINVKRTFDFVSTGFDVVKSYAREGLNNKKRKIVEKKVTHLGPIQLSHGWYADSMSGLQKVPQRMGYCKYDRINPTSSKSKRTHTKYDSIEGSESNLIEFKRLGSNT